MSNPLIRLRATIVMEYDANPDHYDNKPPAEMAALDEQNFADPAILFETLLTKPYTVKVEPVEAQP